MSEWTPPPQSVEYRAPAEGLGVLRKLFEALSRRLSALEGAAPLRQAGVTVKVLGLWLDRALHVAGDFTSTGNADITGTSHIGGTTTIDGGTTIDDTLHITGATDIDGTLNVDAATTIGGTLGVTGTTTLGAPTTVSGTLGVTGVTTLGGATTVSGTLTVTGHATIAGVDVTVMLTSQAAALAELGGDLGAWITAIQSTLDSHGATLSSHTSTLSSHTSTLASHTSTLASHGEDLGNVWTAILDLTERVGLLENP